MRCDQGTPWCAPSPDFAVLQAGLAQLCTTRPFRSAWALRDIGSGLSCDERGDWVVPAASTRKIPILVTALSAVRRGVLDLEQPLVVTRELQGNDSGCLRFLRPGLTLTLYDALVMMIIVSDNSATAAVVDLLGLDEINRCTHVLGMWQTRHRAAAPETSRLDEPTPTDLNGVNVTTANENVPLPRDCPVRNAECRRRRCDRPLAAFVPSRAGHPVRPANFDASTRSAANRHEGRSQDRKWPLDCERRRDRLSRRSPALHPRCLRCRHSRLSGVRPTRTGGRPATCRRDG